MKDGGKRQTPAQHLYPWRHKHFVQNRRQFAKGICGRYAYIIDLAS